MPPVTFETFDPAPYQRVPRLTVEGALALARALMQIRPKGASELDRVAGKLVELIAEVEVALTVRRREAAPVDYTMEVELDGVTDALWAALRNRLETWAAFSHPGLSDVIETLEGGSATEIVLSEAQRRSARARALRGNLFGADGLKFTQTTFAEQAQTMASILRLIDEEGLATELDALVGAEVLAGLRACQQQYEAMVEGRMERSERKSADLGQLRGKLQRAIARYSSAVLLLLDEDEPSSLSLVVDALRPVDDAEGLEGSS